MEFTFWSLLAIWIVVMSVLFITYFSLSNKDSDSHSSRAAKGGLVAGLLSGIILSLSSIGFLPKYITVYPDETHNSRYVLNGDFLAQVGETYLKNDYGEDLICMGVSYSRKGYGDDSSSDDVYIPIGELKRLTGGSPDYYFFIPSFVKSRSWSEVKWCLIKASEDK